MYVFQLGVLRMLKWHVSGLTEVGTGAGHVPLSEISVAQLLYYVIKVLISSFYLSYLGQLVLKKKLLRSLSF